MGMMEGSKDRSEAAWSLRDPLPELPAPKLRLAARETAAHVVIEGAQYPRHIAVQGDLLRVRFRWSDAPPHNAVRAWTNLDSPQGSFASLPFTRDEDGSYLLEAALRYPGRAVLYVQLQSPDGDWLQMRGEPWRLIVYPKQLKGLRLYVFIPAAQGPLDAWADRLDEIRALGFSMIHILPITWQGDSQSPYSAARLFSLEPSLLPGRSEKERLEVWEDFVDAARRKAIGLCIDLVFNHVAVDSEIARTCPHWLVQDASEADGLKRAGFWAGQDWQKWNDLVLVDYSHPDPDVLHEIWAYFREYALRWASYAAATDGMLRLDNLHSTPPAFAIFITRDIRKTYPNLAILGEFFDQHDALEAFFDTCEIDLLLATTWEHHFTHELRTYLKYLHQSSHRLSWLTLMNSHDSGTPAEEFTSVRATLPRYTIAALMGSGATGLTQGVERGILNKIRFIGRSPELSFDPDGDFRAFITRINELLASEPCFQQGAAIQFLNQKHPAVLVAIRYRPEDMNSIFLVLANLDIHSGHNIGLDTQAEILRDRDFHDVYWDRPWDKDLAAFHLEACGFCILRCRRKAVAT